MFQRAVLMSLVAAGLTACGSEAAVDPGANPVKDSVVLAADRDNTLFDDGGQLSNGSGQHLFAGTTQLLRRRRGLLRFDVARAGIAPGEPLDSVTLTLYMSRSIAGSTEVTLHRVTADWGEGTSVGPVGEGSGGMASPRDATWLHRFFDSDRWTTPGGDYDPTPSAGTSVQEVASYRWGSTAKLVADVEGWLAAPASNFGWIVIGDESRRITAKRFDSREITDAGRRPTLRVYFTRR